MFYLRQSIMNKLSLNYVYSIYQLPFNEIVKLKRSDF